MQMYAYYEFIGGGVLDCKPSPMSEYDTKHAAHDCEDTHVEVQMN